MALTDLKYPRCPDNGRLPLPFGKFGGFCAVGIYTTEPLTVFVKDRNLPVLVLAPLVFSELRAFSLFQGPHLHMEYLNCGRGAQVLIRALPFEE